MQLAGLNGAFLTGDVFNLFVFFEVLLIASYALLLHDAGGRALRSGLHYVVINLIGASLFLIAASLLYGVAGTLNFADLAVKLPALPDWDAGLARAAALLLLVVFGVKAALLPLGFWLPETYGSAPGPVAALFAIMTKVGIYAIVRVSLTVFGGGSGGQGLLGGLERTRAVRAGSRDDRVRRVRRAGRQAPDRADRLSRADLVRHADRRFHARPRGTGRRAVLPRAHHARRGGAVPAGACHRRPARTARRPLRQRTAGRAADAAGPAVPAVRRRRGGPAAAVRIHRQGADAAGLRRACRSRRRFWAAVLGSGLLATFALARAGGSLFWKTHGAAVGIADAGRRPRGARDPRCRGPGLGRGGRTPRRTTRTRPRSSSRSRAPTSTRCCSMRRCRRRRGARH